jgi:MtrB/PioB family decaheme-associated outer membrane protein
VINMNKRSKILSLAIASVLLAGVAQSQEAPAPAAPDPSTWACKKCPFPTGHDGAAELGAGYLSDDSAAFGDGTGLDEKGAYVVAGASGKAYTESGYSLTYDLANLGLDSREVRVDGGKQGAYDFSLFYDRVPRRITDTAQSVYSGLGGSNLTLPAGWTTGGNTQLMPDLDDNLRKVDTGFDRDRYGAGFGYWLGKNIVFGVDYKHDERDGTRPMLGSFGSVAVQFLRPVSDSTDRLNATARYEGSKWFAQVGYYASIYNNDAAKLRFENPFNSFVPGGEAGQTALEPDNDYQEIALSAGLHGLPWNTVIGVSAAAGEGTQDASYLPYTINPNLVTDALPRGNLDGKVKVNRADLTVSMRPIDRLRLRGAVAWDERKNDTPQEFYTSIVHTDLFPVSDDRLNAVYGYDRLRLTGSADFDIYSDLTIGVGGEYKTLDRKGTTQEVKGEDTQDGWVRAQYRPSGYLGFVVKGGIEERDPDKYDTTVAAGFDQNPLMRKYELAYRYRSYIDFLANVAVGSLPLTLSANGFYADDSYLQSDLGLVAGLDRRYGLDLTWAINDKVSAYAAAGLEKISSRNKGSSTFSFADWRGNVDDEFQTYGGGVRAHIADKMQLNVDYTYAKGDSKTTIDGVSAGAFPAVTSRLDTLKADFSYQLSPRTDLVFSWWHEKLDSKDWAIQGIEPATLPTVLALGYDPNNYNVDYVTASVRYYFKPRGEAPAAE